jgi:sec-independent protein translocase protein TatA
VGFESRYPVRFRAVAARGERSFMLAMFGVGPTELIIVAVIILLLFGSRLPTMMRSMGMSISEFKKGVKEGEQDAPEKKLEQP